MSQMRVSSPRGGEMWWKVLRFTSPITGTVASAQTRVAEVHYPIKASQQMLEFQLITSSVDEMHGVQEFVRQTQLGSIGTGSSEIMNMWWPERGIDGWTGVPLSIQAGGDRFVQAAQMIVRVQLIDSMISERTFNSSRGSDFDDIIGTLVSPYVRRRRRDDTDGFSRPSGPGTEEEVLTPPHGNFLWW